MSNFGEINFESSRAAADDEEDEGSLNQLGLELEWTKEGDAFLKNDSKGSYTFCAFTGKVAVGFGEGFLSSDKWTLLGQMFVTGNEGTIDLCSLRPRRKRPVLRLYLGGKIPLVFALIDFHGVPRILSNDLVQMTSGLIDGAAEVVIFHSETSVYNRCDDEECEGKLFYLTSSKVEKGMSPSKGAALLTPPNIVSGPSAAILTHCEMVDKPGLMFVTYCETELVDSISMKAFLTVVSPHEGNKKKSSLFNLPQLFSQFEQKIGGALNPQVTSNLYA